MAYENTCATLLSVPVARGAVNTTRLFIGSEILKRVLTEAGFTSSKSGCFKDYYYFFKLYKTKVFQAACLSMEYYY